MASIQLGPSGEVAEDTQIQFTPEERVYQLRAEVERLRKESQELKLQYLSDQGQWIEETGRLRAALRKWDALIQYQYNGSREAMSALQECAFETDAILKGYALGEKE